jgi:hypothetical protein
MENDKEQQLTERMTNLAGELAGGWSRTTRAVLRSSTSYQG